MREVNGHGRSPRTRWTIVFVVAALAGVWLTMMLGGTGPLDRLLYRALYTGGSPGLADVARAVTVLGDPRLLVPATLLLAAWLWWRGHPHTAITLILVTMTGRGVNSLVKLDVARVRPALQPHLTVESTNSFPSGHATGSMIFFLSVALLLAHRGPWRRWAAVAAVALAILVGTSRVMLGVHWPSDVVGGWAFGALWVILTLRMAEDLVELRVKR